MSPVPTPPAPRPRPSQSARAFSAARAEYLAGAEVGAVCRRHDIRPAYFLRMAGEQGWRRPDPAPTPAPAAKEERLVIPEAPSGASRNVAAQPAPPRLSAVQMADKAWAMLAAAVAAGRLIEARGWLRLYKELKPFAREDAEAERRARMDRDAEQAREAIAPPLHCFSSRECNDETPSTPSRSGSTGGSRHADAAEPAPHRPRLWSPRPGRGMTRRRGTRALHPRCTVFRRPSATPPTTSPASSPS